MAAQTTADKDSPGDCGCGAVDEDLDGDTISDCIDNCPEVANSDQFDADRDGIGNPCDSSPWGSGGGEPTEQQADDDPTLDDSPDAVDSEESNLDGIEEEVNLEQAEELDEREGSAEADDDDDGVENQFDKCPNTAAAVRVDAAGCVADLVLMLAPPATDDLDDEVVAGACGQGLGLLELSCMLSFAATFGASGRRRNRRVLSVLRR